jgi:hypothetical protein
VTKKRPKIRLARFVDIPEITRLSTLALSASRYSGFASIQPDQIKRAAVQWIGLQGDPDRLPRGMVVVCETGQRLEGMLVGVLTPLYDGLDVALATDLIWFAQPGAHATSAARMLKAFHKWAGKYPGHVVFRHGVTDAIKDPESTGKMLERAGFRRSGFIYEKET